jgi:hypothetical protein
MVGGLIWAAWDRDGNTEQHRTVRLRTRRRATRVASKNGMVMKHPEAAGSASWQQDRRTADSRPRMPPHWETQGLSPQVVRVTRRPRALMSWRRYWAPDTREQADPVTPTRVAVHERVPGTLVWARPDRSKAALCIDISRISRRRERQRCRAVTGIDPPERSGDHRGAPRAGEGKICCAVRH